MGIKDLLSLYKTLLTKQKLSNFRGKTCAIDMMVWLYKGMYAMNYNPKSKDIYLNYPLKMLTLLKENNINCIAVFDGNLLPAKIKGFQERKSSKISNDNIFKGNLVNSGHLNVNQIQINTLIYLLKKLKFKIIVAPYESDAQIAYLYHHNKIDFAITEDSDLIPYGVKRIAFKMSEKGDFEYLNLNLNEIPPNILNNLKEEEKFILNLSHLKLVQFCVLCGCDYIKPIKGLGMKTLIKLFKEVDTFEDIIKSIISYGKYTFETQNGDDSLYLKQAKEACSVFYYQMIYDDDHKKMKHLFEDTLWHYFRKVDNLNDIVEKSWITDVIGNNHNKNYYGKSFENYIDYCNGEFDIEKYSSENNLDILDSINKYLKLYSKILSN